MKRLLRSHRDRHYSQSGEDGILEFILSKIQNRDSWCVEFGALDGKHLSNTYHFITNVSYKGVMIEGDPTRYSQLEKNMANEGLDVICINQFVGIDGENKLDAILAKTPTPINFDLLSIDIDGDDYYVWEQFSNFRPKVVIIEINFRDKPGVRKINISDSPYIWGETGTSIDSMTELAEKKGYSLIAQVGSNAVYVDTAYYSLFFRKPIEPMELFSYEAHNLRELEKREILSYIYWNGKAKFLKELLKQFAPSSIVGLLVKIKQKIQNF